MSAWMARNLVVLGDSTAVGLGDPLPDRRWRGVGPLLADALGARLTNLSFTGARMACVRHTQLPPALSVRPDVAAVLVGMNDTLRSDFDPEDMRVDLAAVVERLAAAGAVVLVLRYHDHGRVFRLPKSLKRALRERIGQLNAVIDSVVEEYGAACLDLDLMPGVYELESWSVDRLHPSELGHRKLAAGLGELLAARGCELRRPVSLVCSGGLQPTTAQHVAWLVVKGVPWLWRRSRDLLPYAVGVMIRSWLNPEPEIAIEPGDVGGAYVH